MMDALKKMLDEYRIPPVIEIKTKFDKTRLPKAEEVLWRAFKRKTPHTARHANRYYRRKSRYCGLSCRDEGRGPLYQGMWGCPFIVPAMGSHGGATAEGQVEVLKHLGITEETVGAPIYSSMDVVEIARTELGLPVYLDRIASEADGILSLNRVKTHTSIYGAYQSGLVKMMAIDWLNTKER